MIHSVFRCNLHPARNLRRCLKNHYNARPFPNHRSGLVQVPTDHRFPVDGVEPATGPPMPMTLPRRYRHRRAAGQPVSRRCPPSVLHMPCATHQRVCKAWLRSSRVFSSRISVRINTDKSTFQLYVFGVGGMICFYGRFQQLYIYSVFFRNSSPSIIRVECKTALRSYRRLPLLTVVSGNHKDFVSITQKRESGTVPTKTRRQAAAFRRGSGR